MKSNNRDTFRLGSDFQKLFNIFREIATLRGVKRLLSWDQETYMPCGGVSNRSRQYALISNLIHQRLTCQETRTLIEKLQARATKLPGDHDETVCLRWWKRSCDRAISVPQQLVRDLAETVVKAHEAWRLARQQADFSIFEPYLERIVALSREKAHCIGFDDHPYDALLDEYEPGTSTRELDQLFTQLIPGIKRIIKDLNQLDHPAENSSPKSSKGDFQGPFPIREQKMLAKLAASRIGFDFASGRMDTVIHPFSTNIGPGDCRITSRWNKEDFTQGFFGILHEAGHGIYSQNLPAEWFGSPLGESASLGVHESQSRLWENIVGRSRAFWEYFYPIAQGFFPNQLEEISLTDFLTRINRVHKSYIRVNADEVTYNLHVYLRFEVEKQLISGELSVSQLPEYWNQLFQDLLDKPVPNDAMGCLQDVHWSSALFGYFPTYVLGNIYGAMLFEAASRDIPGLKGLFSNGEFKPLFKWLKNKIHILGQRHEPSSLISLAVGQEVSPKPFLNYLEKKYLKGQF